MSDGLSSRIEAHCHHRPDAPAVRCGSEVLDYAGLHQQAERLARRLREAGAGPGGRVAVLLPRRPELLVALLAIYRCGAAYLPIDPDYPAERIAFMLEDAGALLLTRSEWLGRAGPARGAVLLIESAAEPATPPAAPAAWPVRDPDDPFYLIYTSGSTGQPKGALLHERGVVNLFEHYAAEHAAGPDSRYLVLSAVGFDLTQKNLWVPLMVGGCVVFPASAVYDPGELIETIGRERVTHLNCTPSAFHGLIDEASEADFQRLATLTHVQLGGEPIQPQRLARWWHNPHNRAVLLNGYGPTECSAVVAMHRIEPGQRLPAERVPIGRAVPGLRLHVLDAALQPVAPGEAGELVVAGVGVGLGYHQRPELSAERFITLPFESGRCYRSGDRVRLDDEGRLDYLGRLDGQVKLRGFRVELGEVEAALAALPGVRAAACTVHDERLCAYWVGEPLAPALLRQQLERRLPEFMLPSVYLGLPALPVNAHGKLDRAALPRPTRERPPLAVAYAPPEGALEQQMAALWCELLALDRVGRDDPFFELGGVSLDAIRFIARLARLRGERLPIAEFFATGTLRRYAQRLANRSPGADPLRADGRAAAGSTPAADPAAGDAAGGRGDRRIAIVGMATRLPGADDPETFWQQLRAGVEAIRDLSEAELDAAGVSAEHRADPDYVRRVALCADADCFDAAFFGYGPREAALIDPQQRLLLETAWTALEHAGYDPSRASTGTERVGVYAGVARNSYFALNLAANPATRGRLADVDLTFANDKDYAATRIAYKLDLRGPALTVQTACSTGGVLLHQARQALLAGDCDVALVGGARVVTPLTAGYPWIDGNIFSRDGRMRVFDAEGSGMIRASGAITLVLKRLADAERDGDTIHAVILGSALNNDGADKLGYTAPSVPGQIEVIRRALADAGVSAREIGYVEAHGTATRLGDPMEVSALNAAFAVDGVEEGRCGLGSVKSNIGHLDPAAALAGVVKTALSLAHGELPPTLHYQRPNPEIPFAGSPFRVIDRLQPWPAGGGPRRAGVSSFGIGGTNAHLILEAPPARPESPAAARAWQLLPLSAKTPEALQASAERLAAALPQQAAPLADVAWTLQKGRAGFSERGFVVARDGAEAAARLRQGVSPAPGAGLGSVIFVFPGQGSQHPGMGEALYRQEPLFRAILDEGCALLQPLLGVDLRSLLYPDAEQAETAAAALRQTGLAQPAIYLLSYATARLWQSLGVQPARLIGHSVGEYVAATLAGVFRFADALKVLAERARLMQAQPPGSMLAVRLPEAELRPLLPAGVGIAALNAPRLSIVSGPTPAISAFEAQLGQQGIGCVALHTSHAFHSPMMDPVLPAFEAVVASVPRQPPQLPILSTLSGEPLSAEQAQDPAYWARQLREPVRFAPAVSRALQEGPAVLLEVGPGQALGGPLRQIAGPAVPVVSSLPAAAQEQADAGEALMTALGRLWQAGVQPDWLAVHGGVARQRRPLPGTVFARVRHWIEGSHPLTSAVSSTAVEGPASAEAATASATAVDPQAALTQQIAEVMTAVTGLSLGPAEQGRSFLELGMDSLVLTQIAGKLKNAFRVDLRFRQLLEELNTLERLAAWLQAQGARSAASASRDETAGEAADPGRPRKAFGAAVRISTERDVLAPAQRRALNQLLARYIARTGASKAATQQHRAHFADPRSVSGFKPMWKEAVYPIVSTRSQGPYLWDLDGHRYIDTVNGFGATLFGHKPAFVDQALREQIDKGYEVGPVQDFLGEAARLFTEMVGLDRVAFCNTGSEAVSAAQRCARTVTGKDLIASFAGDYHGVHDEVIVRPGPNGRGFPAASGIPNAHTSQTLILDYGDPKSLEILRNRADELAAILIEPIQSRNQDLQPRAFIHALREIASQAGCAFIMDEVITGFRIARGGAQEHFGVKADIGCYGKVFGGGLPVGAVAGIPRYLDALDGGWWQFGDASVPEAGVTFFAGTFVRHPLAMAASLATLRHLQAHPEIQPTLNRRVTDLVARLRAAIAETAAPVRVTHYTSIFRFEAAQEEPFFELLAHYFRLNGVHTYDHRNQVMTTAHDEAVFEALFEAYIGGIRQMQADGLLGRVGAPVSLGLGDRRPGAIWYAPPVAGARLGRDAAGNPAWYVADAEAPGGYRAVEEEAL
ncbi:MAG TPA: amino acid adenylation domain-containing protein [Nevskiaceae bacterium]|nr:amino acid adenylation domain-containing protein [Nevskiaceae bacterium]